METEYGRGHGCWPPLSSCELGEIEFKAPVSSSLPSSWLFMEACLQADKYPEPRAVKGAARRGLTRVHEVTPQARAGQSPSPLRLK